jgi:hypothetical protein
LKRVENKIMKADTKKLGGVKFKVFEVLTKGKHIKTQYVIRLCVNVWCSGRTGISSVPLWDRVEYYNTSTNLNDLFLWPLYKSNTQWQSYGFLPQNLISVIITGRGLLRSCHLRNRIKCSTPWRAVNRFLHLCILHSVLTLTTDVGSLGRSSTWRKQPRQEHLWNEC